MIKIIYKSLWMLGLCHLIFSFIFIPNIINFINIFIGLFLVIGAFISYEK